MITKTNSSNLTENNTAQKNINQEDIVQEKSPQKIAQLDNQSKSLTSPLMIIKSKFADYTARSQQIDCDDTLCVLGYNQVRLVKC